MSRTLCLVALVTLPLACQAQPFGGAKPVSGPCAVPEGGNQALLRQVCEHVVANRLPVTSHPNTWSVRRTEESLIDGNPVIAAYLSCCYIGDVAYFDKNTGKLVRYVLGPK